MTHITIERTQVKQWLEALRDIDALHHPAEPESGDAMKAIADMELALAQPEQKPQICCGEYDTCLRACTPRGRHLAQPAQRTEQNFCPRCGKRTQDIHTCTPPSQEKNT